MRGLKLFAVGTDSKDVEKWTGAVQVVIARNSKEALKIAGRGPPTKYIELDFIEVLKYREVVKQFAINLFNGRFKENG